MGCFGKLDVLLSGQAFAKGEGLLGIKKPSTREGSRDLYGFGYLTRGKSQAMVKFSQRKTDRTDRPSTISNILSGAPSL